MVATGGSPSIDGFSLSIDGIVAALHGGRATLSEDARERCLASRAQVERWLVDDAPVVYGINTGLGNLKDVVLSPTEHVEWNATIPYPHAAGLGDYIHPRITRTALLVRANVLARGYSGARPELIERLLDLFNAGVAPAIRELASVGLSDLAPLAHIAMVASGIEGARVVVDGVVVQASAVIEAAGLVPRFVYQCKDTLSTMNGASMTQAAGILVVRTAMLLLARADRLAAPAAAGAAAVDQGADELVRAIWETVDEVRGTLDFECNVSCDNPLLFEVAGDDAAGGDAAGGHMAGDYMAGDYEAVMGCNCSNTQVGYDLDLLSALLAERASLLLDRQLMRHPGPAAARVREIGAQLMQRLLDAALPASVDSIPTKSGSPGMSVDEVTWFVSREGWV